MILDVLYGFDAAYDKVSSSLDFDLDYSYTTNLIKGKEVLNPFLRTALLDCFTLGDSGTYSNLIFSKKENLDFFKVKHSKKEFIQFIGNLNKTLKN